ncbi:SWIM zinc finger family protein [Anaerocolumna sedimenticola]|nr:SWIM zinc finger family protein [Anaerocolumna sedimenticola]
MIDTEHPKKSKCNCPHADGKKIVCKHKIALFFTAFPKEADNYITEFEEYEREEEDREQERYDQIVKYVESLSKEELRMALINGLVEADESFSMPDKKLGSKVQILSLFSADLYRKGNWKI